MPKIALLLTTFNRPSYLKDCLKSLMNSDLWLLDTVLIVDDKSTDYETIQLINTFIKEAAEKFDKVEFVAAFSKENGGIKKSLLYGYELLFKTHTDIVNLDPDAVVANIWLHKIIEAKNQYPEMMISGFHCNTLNRDGSVRHKVLYTEKNYSFRKTVGGISLYINKTQYYNWVKPALEGPGNWDERACLNSAAESIPICVTVPSVISHVGEYSAMGHHLGGEPEDQSDDFKLLYLPNVTLIGADGLNVERLIHAVNISCSDIVFGDVKILSHLPSYDPRIVKIRPLLSSKDYSQFILKDIINYVSTDYMILVQHDGFIIHAESFTDELYKYDFAGAVWGFRQEKRTANGGMSWRSKKMCEIIRDDDYIQLKNDHIITNFAEDHVLFYIHREYLESVHGIRIAPEELCDKFSIEAWGVPDNKYKGSFGFHGFNVDFNDSDLPYVPYKLPNRQIL